jgi:ceramide glucosyltransferase
MIHDVVLLVFLGGAALGCVYMSIAAVMVLRGPAFKNAPLRNAPAVTILKPLHGNETSLLENLISFCEQDYAGPVQIVFGVASASDSAIAVVEHLRSSYPKIVIELVVDERVAGNNPKASNLINMQSHAKYETIVVADSDIKVKPDYLTQIVGALDGYRGAVTAPYYGIASATVASKLSQLAIESHFLPGVIVGAGFGLAQPCLGSTIAFRKDALVAIGGFEAVSDHLADDYKLGELFAQSQYPVKLLPFAVGHVCGEKSLSELWRHELRWNLTIRAIDPVRYAGWTVDHALPFALIAWIIGAGWPGFLLSVAALGCRAALVAACERRFDLPRRPYWLIPLRDLLSFAVFVGGFMVRHVTWRGRQYKLGPQGILLSDRRLPAP